MKRKIMICLCVMAVMSLSIGCGQEVSENIVENNPAECTKKNIIKPPDEEKDVKSEEVPEVNYDYINSRKVVKEALDSNWRISEYVLEIINIPEIKGVVMAELIPEDNPESSDITLEIMSEDNIKYYVYMTRSYRIFAIEEIETSKVVYFSD